MHYGMYSKVYQKNKLYTLPQIIVNGDSNFNIRQSSLFDQESLFFFYLENESNEINLRNKHGYFQRKGIRKTMLSTPQHDVFNKFLLDYAGKVLGIKVDSIGFYMKKYIYNGQIIAVKAE
jgi:hypothetical protein